MDFAELEQSVPAKLAMYAAGYPAFREHLAGLGDERMWQRLTGLFERSAS